MPAFAPDLLAAWTGGHWTRPPETAPTGFSQDTRTLTPGQVFVALRTERRDGHDFLAAAAARGAAAALVTHAVPRCGLPQLVVADPLAAFQGVARAHRRDFPGAVVGVSGSAGKTSTKDLLALLLGGPPRVLATADNLNNSIGVPLTLTRLDRNVQVAAVVEAGISAPGEMTGLAGMIAPDHSVITLVGPAHLEQLGTLEGVAWEKSRLPAANRPGGLAVFPAACRAYAGFRELAQPLVLVPADADEAAATGPGRSVRFAVRHALERTEVTLDGRRTFGLRRVSDGMAENAALALALVAELGVADAELAARLDGWQPGKGRGELVTHGAALVYRDYYNANPASMRDALTAFAALVPPALPRLYVLGGMEELGAAAAAYHCELGRGLRLRPGDQLCVIGPHAGAVQAGLLEAGNDPAALTVGADPAELRERVAGFAGAVFLKGSRRYRLETLLAPAAPAHA